MARPLPPPPLLMARPLVEDFFFAAKMFLVNAEQFFPILHHSQTRAKSANLVTL